MQTHENHTAIEQITQQQIAKETQATKDKPIRGKIPKPSMRTIYSELHIRYM